MTPKAHRVRVLWAFAAVYIIWGSTYLAILFAIDTLPPFLMASVRFLLAGTALFLWRAARGAPRPTPAEWRGAAITGLLMLMGGNGAVVWSEQYVPSGVVALIVAVVPLWMVLLDWLWQRNAPPTLRVITGVLLGFGGIALLIGPDALGGSGSLRALALLAPIAGSLSWAIGSLYARKVTPVGRPFQAIAMQMLAGGTGLLILSVVTGEMSALDVAAISLRSVLAVLYLAAFGSIIAYSAYVWLLGHVDPARVATYAYVNPIVAVLLGWALAGEALTLRMLFASIVIVAGVALITWLPRSQLELRRREQAERTLSAARRVG
ncbi:MAG TPA: EamA family transporter [Longimicrobiales bacterium]|nr:EamA family transporter [Longimicrobiales bacterium]